MLTLWGGVHNRVMEEIPEVPFNPKDFGFSQQTKSFWIMKSVNGIYYIVKRTRGWEIIFKHPDVSFQMTIYEGAIANYAQALDIFEEKEIY